MILSAETVSYQSEKRADGANGADGVADAIDFAVEYLLSIQYPEGFWWGELESNPTMEAEYLMLLRFLGVEDPGVEVKLRNHLLHAQRDDGTWGLFYGSPGDLSTSIECYFALKLAGMPPDDPRMAAARRFILSKGGPTEARVFTKIWLSLFGQYDWRGVPAIPAELMLLPTWFPVNLYEFSSWARATIVPLLIIFDLKPTRDIAAARGIEELYPLPRDEVDYSLKRPERLFGWESLFYAGDAILKQLERLPWPTRGQAVRRAEEWIAAHQEADGSWGGIQPPWVYSLMALKELGYELDHPVMRRGIEGFKTFWVEDEDRLRVQACVSPGWDTCLALIGLLDAGADPNLPELVKAGEWLVREQSVSGGDWQVKAPEAPPGGWAFEFHNDQYPDLDDTSEIVMALDRLTLPDDGAKRESISRAVGWLLGMQSSNGGWAAFDKNNTRTLLAKIPFADFGEVIDPPSVDVTAHILEMLGQLGYDASHPQVARALDYIFDEQEADGSWFGRWGVNYIYGTGAALPALGALGLDMSMEPARRAVRWLLERQNEDGGWGESCISYVDASHKGLGPSTASQTSWALLALLAAGEVGGSATRRGIDYLVRTQRGDGSWDEPYFTGTGFPGYGIGQKQDSHLADPRSPQGHELPAGFMINYHMYRNYWPLMALGRYKRMSAGGSRSECTSARPNGYERGHGKPNRRLRRLLKIW